MGRRGLGRGLSALIATGESVAGFRFEELPITAIRPNSRQPRREFPQGGIRELAASIREVGILQPLVVRPAGSGFELIAGERRLRAAREAGLDRVPVLIRQAGEGEAVELALVENIQREDLNPLETAGAYQAVMDSFGLTKEQLAARLGKSRAAISNTLRLMQLPDSIKTMLVERKLSEGHARVLLSLEDEDQMRRLAEQVVREKLSVRATERRARELLNQGQVREKEGSEGREGEENNPPSREEDYKRVSRDIQRALSLPTRVRALKRGGKIEIRFSRAEELESFLARITGQDQG
ncbi:ParB/RepB/Spo0J family partition protein [Rubrobacter calidifluminis]|uniref:ParB/RepB/Spo0J family partition protein n=1 Tax=Rubrobacter calidifluminis TaxID=1392640 RepID=UPI00235FFE4F|nr:ParB/RepB/Spo0J family partition protein [Rubrobacter calidifluminis]